MRDSAVMRLRNSLVHGAELLGRLSLMGSRWVPRAMRVPPGLDRNWQPAAIENRYALLINPFYPKDLHASFGKHVLTPTLALTSIAASTPADWRVKYWDENLLQGPPPADPFPQVVEAARIDTFPAMEFN